ncbi:UDP-2,3-diacylglucosamine diphosphatase [Candidatus Vallotia cooleyia]|uniref:UDP-2,3-diacylglucosamine diphosphatase n=1 Tax=Candidatus Vallotiella adelgis TaxID=1177211 RepID=UPI001D0046E1|nr:UDP-2,3-diacylglucosamine diphosphatase [Candidatus Vallotia cooleyia]UDG82307.1 UDP-2,3-diacylglucosamine hydrolase [Candidatus Vallotia cooleyia]
MTSADSSAASRVLLLISDLHLSEALPRTVNAFEYFIRVTARNADSIFILGDLFEYWIGDDMLALPFARHIMKLMDTLSEHRISLYIMHGNRDFLLGRRFIASTGAILLPDPFVITVFGERIVLTHGDILCTADVNYQRFRRISRNTLAQNLFLTLPLRWRKRISESMRRKSLARPVQSSTQYDAIPDALMRLFSSTNTRIMVHGHTHLPACHHQHGTARWVLPDWELDHGLQRGGYLRIDIDGIHMLPLDTCVGMT